MFDLYRCRDCNKVFALTPFDHSPEYRYLPEEGGYKEEFKDERNAHMLRHSGHHLEKLRVLKGTMISERDYHEPVKEIFFEATNGRERFVIKKWRENIHEPMSYQLIRGSLKIIDYLCEIREKEIKKEWLRVMSPPLQGKGIVFLTVLKEIVTEMKISKDARMISATSNPLICYQRLSRQHIQIILKRFKDFVTPLEFNEIRAFIHDQNQVDGVIPLMIKKKFFLEKSDEKRPHVEPAGTPTPLRTKRLPGRIRPAELHS